MVCLWDFCWADFIDELDLTKGTLPGSEAAVGGTGWNSSLKGGWTAGGLELFTESLNVWVWIGVGGVFWWKVWA